MSQEARRLLDVRVLCRPRVFNEKFPKRFLYKRRGRSAEGAANRDHSGRVIADPAATFYLRYNILYHIEYLYVFPLKLLFIRCPFAPEFTRPTSLSCSFCDKQLASSVLLLSQNSRAFSQMTVTHHHHRYCQCHSHQQFKCILISEGCALSVNTIRSR